MFGFINIYKPTGMTSFDVVARLRKIINIRQIGHTGTLDPFAVGVLPICIGKSTKLIEYLPDDKEYLTEIQFGKNTDTYDLDGNVIQIFDKKIKEKELQDSLRFFKGEIEQIPPIYSAIKINGKKLYDYARKGEQVEIRPRKVYISRIELISFDEVQQTAKILISCSKGTYIRSIAYDLGKILNCGGYVKSLERTKAGAFGINTAVKLENITNIDDVTKNLINPADILPQRKYVLNCQEIERISHGQWIKINDAQFITNHPTALYEDYQTVVFLLDGGKIYGVGKIDGNKILAKKVFGTL